jgi:photosystem II stability/assembly factor-like uncharacterized protein
MMHTTNMRYQTGCRAMLGSLLLATIVLASTASAQTGTWERVALPAGIDSIQLSHLCFLDSARGWAAAGRSVIATRDGGDTWSVLTLPNFASSGVQFLDDSIGWAWTWGGVLRTTDAGATWHRRDVGIQFEHPDGDSPFGITTAFFTNPSTGWVAGNYQGIFATTDGGSSWRLQHVRWDDPQQPMEFYYVMDLFFADSLRGWAAGGDRKLYPMRTTDGGATWLGTTGPPAQLPAGAMLAASFTGGQNGWAAGDFYGYYATTNGGVEWNRREITALPGNVFIQGVARLDSLHGWMCGGITEPTRGVVFHTDDGGATWDARIVDGASAFHQIVFPDPAHGYALAYGQMFRYRNAPSSVGETDEAISLAILPNPSHGAPTADLHLDAPSTVTIEIADAAGRVRTPPRTMHLEPGVHRITLEPGARGTFFARVRIGDRTLTRAFVYQ